MLESLGGKFFFQTNFIEVKLTYNKCTCFNCTFCINLYNHVTTTIIKMSVSQSFRSLSYVWLCDPMDCSTPGFPALHYLPEFVQIHVHWIDDATQPSHPLPSPSPLSFNLPSIRVFSQWVSSNEKQTHVQMGSGLQADCPPSCDGVGWARGPS